MDFDNGEIAGYKHVYAQALIQTQKDLASGVQQFKASVYGSASPVKYDWYLVVISHLTALDRDKDGIDPSLLVPSLSFAVSLWMEGRLSDYGLTGQEPRDDYQREINANVALRLDNLFAQGDPLLAAVCIERAPDLIRHMARHAGLTPDKAQEVGSILEAKAKPIADRAWKLFGHYHPPANVSMFRPLRRLGEAADRRYFR